VTNKAGLINLLLPTRSRTLPIGYEKINLAVPEIAEVNPHVYADIPMISVA
jgi:hypothetical protein